MCLPVDEIDFEKKSFDVVISSLTFHYIAFFEKMCHKIHSILVPEGEFVFSVEHPVFTSYGTQEWVTDDTGKNLFWPVDRYCEEGSRNANFLGESIVKYHRTVTSYLDGVIKSGFEITNIIEPQPSLDLQNTVKGMKDELRRPMMLLVRAKKKCSRFRTYRNMIPKGVISLCL